MFNKTVTQRIFEYICIIFASVWLWNFQPYNFFHTETYECCFSQIDAKNKGNLLDFNT